MQVMPHLVGDSGLTTRVQAGPNTLGDMSCYLCAFCVLSMLLMRHATSYHIVLWCSASMVQQIRPSTACQASAEILRSQSTVADPTGSVAAVVPQEKFVQLFDLWLRSRDQVHEVVNKESPHLFGNVTKVSQPIVNHVHQHIDYTSFMHSPSNEALCCAISIQPICTPAGSCRCTRCATAGRTFPCTRSQSACPDCGAVPRTFWRPSFDGCVLSLHDISCTFSVAEECIHGFSK